VRSRLRRRRPRSVRTAAVVSAGTALVLAAALVWHSAYAGFSDVTTALPATIGTGTLTLTDDDSAVRMFALTGLKPGATGSSCITVTAGGTAPSTVKLYGTGRSSTNALGNYLNLRVETGSKSAGCSIASPTTVYSGTLTAFPTSGWSSGVGTLTSLGRSTSLTYKITYTLSSSTPSNAQNSTATMTFVWEARTK
jgi:hypothetical protein